MFVMMPQVNCVDGSRVKNIKKHFEVLSGETTSKADIKIKCSSSPQNDGKVSRKLPLENSQRCVVREAEESKNAKSNAHLKESVAKNDKCNIKRSPAFRCDRIVKGKNVTGQAKDKQISVEDKVKLFEVGGMKVSGKSRVVPEHPNDRRTVETKVTLKSGNMKEMPSISTKSFSNRESVAVNSRRNHNITPSARLNAFESKVNLPLPLKPPSGDVICERLAQLNNGCGFMKDNSQVGLVETNKVNLTDILKSPLPRGPPPRKPPRTFAHSNAQPEGNSKRVLKSSSSTKECSKETPRTTIGETAVMPVLVRSKTESQIELRNKLETVLAKLHSDGEQSLETTGKSTLLEGNKNNLTHPSRTRPAHKPDISPSSLLVGCLSLGCVSSHQYEEIGAGRQCQFFVGASDKRERMDIRSSLIDAAGTTNTSLSLVRSQSEDHIYAVPFGEVKSQETCIPKLENLPQSYSKILKNQTDELLKAHAHLGNPESNGLHYMCTPILTYGKLHSLNTSEENTHVAAVPHLNLLRLGAVRQNCPSHHSTGVIKGPENSKMVTSQAQSLMSQNFDAVQLGIPEGNHQEDSRESRLTVSVGHGDFNKGSKTSLASPSTETEEENTEEEHDGVTEEIVERRRGYVRRMCSMFQKLQLENSDHLQGTGAANFHGKNGQNSKTSPLRNNASQPSQSSPSSQIPPSSFQHLFECVLLVGLTLNSDRGEGKNYEPYVQSKFPADVLVPPWIEHLCFPDASDWPISNSASNSKACVGDDVKRKESKTDSDVAGAACRGRTYSLVITGPDGSRRFGYCRRVLPEGESMCLPLNYCLISPYRANGFYFKVLAELESRHGQPECERTAFLQELYSCPLPGPGQVPCPPSTSSSPSPFIASLKRPVDTRLEERDVLELLSSLEVGVFLDVFASLLLERKVLLTSKSLSKLSSCVEALQSILYPFSWQHTFIPVLPAPMLDVCNAPTPYIIGVLKGCNGQIPSIILDEGIMVDLDNSHYIQRVGDEGSILPSRVKRALQSTLRFVTGLNTSPQPCHGKKNSAPDGDTPVCNVLISEAFLRVFLLVVGHYPNHVVKQPDGQKVFQRESFIKVMPFSGVKMFLEWFTETAMFSTYINSCLEGGSESAGGIFEQRALKFCEESEKDALLFLKNYKALGKKKTFGDRLKDWAPFA